MADTTNESSGPWNVALLTNILLPHRVALLQVFASRIRKLHVFLSAESEPDRVGRAGFKDLSVTLQHSVQLERRFQNVHGYSDISFIHVPIDTLYRLYHFRPDVILTGEFGVRTFFSVLYRKLNPQTKVIIWATLSQRTEATRGRFRRTLRRLLLKNADACFVNGRDGELYLRSLGYAGPAYAIPYVVEGTLFEGESRVIDDGVIHLLYVGQLVERKGCYRFFVALFSWCQDHPETSIFYRIVGDGSERERLEALSPPPNLRVEFVGHLDLSQVAAAYHDASIYTFPTLGDEWGIVVNEALSAGLPILASKHSLAAEELILEGSNGWFFDPYDDKSIHRALDVALKTGYAGLQGMSLDCRRSIASYTLDAIASTMIAAIAEVCAH